MALPPLVLDHSGVAACVLGGGHIFVDVNHEVLLYYLKWNAEGIEHGADERLGREGFAGLPIGHGGAAAMESGGDFELG